jgi:hypothetical protein
MCTSCPAGQSQRIGDVCFEIARYLEGRRRDVPAKQILSLLAEVDAEREILTWLSKYDDVPRRATVLRLLQARRERLSDQVADLARRVEGLLAQPEFVQIRAESPRLLAGGRR